MTTDDAAIILAYGEMREADACFDAVTTLLGLQTSLVFVAATPEWDSTGNPTFYTAHGSSPDSPHVKQLLKAGNKGVLVFDKPESTHVQPQDAWSYVVKPILSRYRTQGDLLLLVTRPTGDARFISTAPIPTYNVSGQPKTIVYLCPQVSDEAPKRLFNAAVKLLTGQGHKLDELRIQQGRDLRPTGVEPLYTNDSPPGKQGKKGS